MFQLKTFRQIIAKAGVPYWRFLVFYLLLAAGMAVFDVQLTRTMGDLSNAAVGMDSTALRGLLLTMAYLTVGKLVCDAVNAYLSGEMRGRAEHGLRGVFARHHAYISFPDLTKRPSGDILSLYANDVPGAATLLTGAVLEVLSGGLLLVVSVVFMLRIHWLYTLIFFLSYPLLMLLQIAVSKPIAPLSAESSKLRGVFNGVVNDCLQNTSLILGYGLEEAMEARYLAAYDAYFKAEMRRTTLRTRLVIFGIIVVYLPILFLCVAGAIAVTRGTLNLGEFLALFLLGSGANMGLGMLAQHLAGIRERQASAQRVLDATADPHEPPPADTVLPDDGDAITITDMTFSYDGKTPVLGGVSLTIPRGARVAFVGKSGCGKSTLAKLILGLYAPTEGTIRWLGSAALGPQDARRAVAYVPQDSALFSGTVAENLRCGGAEDTRRLREVLEEAELGGLDGGLERVIEENGENLSGGQRQRLAIARALYRDAPILMLDEATSALDPTTEGAVLTRLTETAKDRTLIMVAHRLAAVAVCDRIYVMEGGTIVEEGSYEELMRPGTYFHALYLRQQEENADE